MIIRMAHGSCILHQTCRCGFFCIAFKQFHSMYTFSSVVLGLRRKTDRYNMNINITTVSIIILIYRSMQIFQARNIYSTPNSSNRQFRQPPPGHLLHSPRMRNQIVRTMRRRRPIQRPMPNRPITSHRPKVMRNRMRPPNLLTIQLHPHLIERREPSLGTLAHTNAVPNLLFDDRRVHAAWHFVDGDVAFVKGLGPEDLRVNGDVVDVLDAAVREAVD